MCWKVERNSNSRKNMCIFTDWTKSLDVSEFEKWRSGLCNESFYITQPKSKWKMMTYWSDLLDSLCPWPPCRVVQWGADSPSRWRSCRVSSPPLCMWGAPSPPEACRSCRVHQNVPLRGWHTKLVQDLWGPSYWNVRTF